SQFFEPFPERVVSGRSSLIAQSRAANACQLAGPSLTDPKHRYQVTGDGLATCRRYHFFDRTSFMASTSSSLSARRRLSLLFSASSSRSRLASLTSRPAYLLRQL